MTPVAVPDSARLVTFEDGGTPHEALTPAVLSALPCDAAGVPLAGREREYAWLRAAGYRDASVGRLFEGHVNALQLVARFGTPAQHERSERDALRGALFGVWNTQDVDGVEIVATDAAGLTLAGRKTFGSGAGRVARAIVTATPVGGGSSRMLLVPMDAVAAGIDRASWQPLGMHDSESFSVSFDRVRVDRDAVIGEPGDYERAPWFSAGASRFLAVQTGALERLVSELAAFFRARGRDADPLQLARFGEAAVAVDGAVLWVDACVAAWQRFDAASPGEADCERDDLLATVDAARVAVEAAALATLERAERAVGARGLLETLPFARMIRDQRMYLRQPAPDAALLRAARTALRRSFSRGGSSPA